MPVHPLGQQIFGEHEFGDGAGLTRNFSGNGATLSYVVSTPAATLTVSYTLQGFAAGTALLTYWVVPPITTFAINGDTTVPKPSTMTYILPNQVGYDQTGVPIIQGYSGVTWEYEWLPDSSIGKLMSFYDPSNPQVTINYPNELGVWTQKQAMMQPPTLGSRSTVIHSGVVFTFTHIIPD